MIQLPRQAFSDFVKEVQKEPNLISELQEFCNGVNPQKYIMDVLNSVEK